MCLKYISSQGSLNDVILNGRNYSKGLYFLGLRSFVRKRDRNKKCNNRVTSMDLFKVKRYYRNECTKRRKWGWLKMNLSITKSVWKLKIRKQIKNIGDYVFNMWNIIVNEKLKSKRNSKSSIQAKIFKYLEFQIRQFGRTYKLYFIYYLQLLFLHNLCFI